MVTLTPELIDQIIFAMEDQAENYVFDTETGELKAEDLVTDGEEDGESRYADIPEWNSSKGFRLMESFVAGLRNPVYREALRSALSRGKGGFRHFKNVLKQNEEIERLWYSFKEREMKREVTEWFEALCEMRQVGGLELDLEHVEETEELVLTDFLFDSAVGGLESRIEELDRIAFEEMFPETGEGRRKSIYERRKAELPEVRSEKSVFLLARTPAGELAGFVWGVTADVGIVKIVQLYILPEYRGLGLGKKCTDHFILSMTERGVRNVEIELYGTGLGFYDYLEKEGMRTFMVRCAVETAEWQRNRSGTAAVNPDEE